MLLMVGMFGAALALMFKNLMDVNKIMANRAYPKPKVRLSHPELEEVEDGDELLVVKFKPEVDQEGTVDLKFTPDEDFQRRVITSDSNLSKSLKDRIDEINDPWDDEDDDDDGDVPAVVRR